MSDQYRASMRVQLAKLCKLKKLSSGEAELLYDHLLRAEGIRQEKDPQLVTWDSRYISGSIELEENTQARQEMGCANLTIESKGRTKETDALAARGVLAAYPKGLALEEPISHALLEILLLGIGSSFRSTPG